MFIWSGWCSWASPASCLHSQVVRVILFDWPLCWWLCCCTACGPLGSMLVPPPLVRGSEWSQLLWLLGTVHCSCLLVPPPWSAGEAISGFMAAVMCGVGSIDIFTWAHFTCWCWKGLIFYWHISLIQQCPLLGCFALLYGPVMIDFHCRGHLLMSFNIYGPEMVEF